MEAIKIFIADDHHLVRENLTEIRRNVDFAVVGFAEDGQQAVKEALEERPDVVRMDIAMPVMNGVVATERTVKREDTIKTLAFIGIEGEFRLEKMFAVGTVGYIHKRAKLKLRIDPIQAAHGQQPLASELWARVGFARRESVTELTCRLSERERDILRLIGEGKTSRQISEQYGLHIRTVRTYRERLMKKLDLHNTSEVVRYCIRNGLIDL